MKNAEQLVLTVFLGFLFLLAMTVADSNTTDNTTDNTTTNATINATTALEQACTSSGGTVVNSSCCASVADFPNLCLIGACGCSPTDSHATKICDCGEGKCFNGSSCVAVAPESNESSGKIKITLKVSDRVIYLGDNLTISGNVSRDGAAGVFTYRVSVVAPPRVVVCDSGRLQTAADGSFSFVCQTPSAADARAANISAINRRFVVPLKAGVAVNDTVNNKNVKKSVEVLAINREKYSPWWAAYCARWNTTVKYAEQMIQRMQELREKAQAHNLTSIVTWAERAENKFAGITMPVYCRNMSIWSLVSVGDDAKEVRNDLKDVREDLNQIKVNVNRVDWSKLKRSCICTMQYDPVCGSDGKTYSNSCAAKCAGAEKVCEGRCPCGSEGKGGGKR